MGHHRNLANSKTMTTIAAYGLAAFLLIAVIGGGWWVLERYKNE